MTCPLSPGTDAALAMAMGHVILKEFYVDRQVPYFQAYARKFTDLPLLVTLDQQPEGFVPGRFLRASDLESGARVELPDWKMVVLDESTGAPAGVDGERCPNRGSHAGETRRAAGRRGAGGPRRRGGRRPRRSPSGRAKRQWRRGRRGGWR